MGLVLGVVIGIIVALLMMLVVSSYRNKNKTLAWQTEPLPEGLGVQHPELKPLAERLEAGLDPAFTERVRLRMQQTHPGMSDDEFACKWFELKRYFMMCAVVERIPMYSEALDDIWHEMLMFTQDYQQFSERFAGRMIHHAPHAPQQDAVKQPGERAWFDCMYTFMFKPGPHTEALWGAFFNVPLDGEKLAALQTGEATEIRKQWIHDSKGDPLVPEVQHARDYLVTQLKQQADKVREYYDQGQRHWGRQDDLNSWMYLSAALMFYSWSDELDFTNGMHSLEAAHKQEWQGIAPAVAQGSCTAAVDSGCSAGGDSGCGAS